MTDIEQKAVALVNKVARELGWDQTKEMYAEGYTRNEALFRAIEEHEAFRQKVSDAVVLWRDSGEEDNFEVNGLAEQDLLSFIIPDAKPDPLMELVKDLYLSDEYADRIRAALDALGLEIREKNDDR